VHFFFDSGHAVPGNVMAVELLWTAEAEAGFEGEFVAHASRYATSVCGLKLLVYAALSY
jgi:hypothetical protein